MTNQEVPSQQTQHNPDTVTLLKSVPVTYHVLNQPEATTLRVNMCVYVSGVLLCLFSGVLSGLSSVKDQQHTVSLSGKWSLSNSNGSVSLPAEVPGCVHSALQQQGYIQDPYFRFNDVSYRWIALDNWTYSTTFNVSTQLRSKQKVLLVFDGVDTVASIQLNGVSVGKTDNMFRRYDLSVRDLLTDGDNELKVSFSSPVLYASERRKAHSAYRVPPECPPDVQKGECHVNFIRKEQSSFSWDWGPSFPTMGLWKGVRLEAFDVLQLIQVSSVPLYNLSVSQWRVQVQLLVDAVQTTNGQITLSIPELESEQTVQTQFLSGKTKNSFTLHINTSSQVKLWWPNGHGDQPFYQLTVRGFQDGFLVLSTESKVYFRTVELVQEPVVGSPGLSFYFRINGKPIFLKGSNWIPAHSFQDQVSPAVLRNLLQSAVDAYMNALRVWGGGVYEQDLFYSICDEMGIMVWQDFMFACAMYPTEDDFIQTVREEVSQQVQRLKSHPSVIIWSGNNENEAALATDWFSIPVSQRPLYRKDYVTLYVNNIRAIVREEDESRPFLVSSPTNGAESEQEGWVAANPYDPLYGDTHFYSYFLDCWDWRTFPRTRFASEYGFQSWPSFSTLQPVSVKADWSYNSSFSSHRQHHENGNQQMLQQAALHFNLPNATEPLKRFTDTLYITQVMQAQCVKTQTEFYRRSQSEIIEGKGRTMGALYWQLNDIWQAPSWSSIEFGGKWKMLHYFAQNFFAAVLPVAFEDNDTLFIYAVSDLSHDLKLRAVVSVYSWANLDPVCTLKSDLLLVPGGSAAAIFKQPVTALLAGCGLCTRLTCLLTFHLEDSGGQQGPTNHHFLSSPKDAQGLQRPNITAKVQQDATGYTVTLHSASVAPYVWLDVGNVPGRFSSNGFLMVSRNRTVGFEAWRSTSVAELSRSLTVTSLADVY
ncbi:beta-mannosidase [Acanthopagrus schlegelii]